MKKGLSIAYWILGGFMLLTSAIAFVYFVLFRYEAIWQQWAAAGILATAGTIFLLVAYELEPKD